MTSLTTDFELAQIRREAAGLRIKAALLEAFADAGIALHGSPLTVKRHMVKRHMVKRHMVKRHIRHPNLDIWLYTDSTAVVRIFWEKPNSRRMPKHTIVNSAKEAVAHVKQLLEGRNDQDEDESDHRTGRESRPVRGRARLGEGQEG